MGSLSHSMPASVFVHGDPNIPQQEGQPHDINALQSLKPSVISLSVYRAEVMENTEASHTGTCRNPLTTEELGFPKHQPPAIA